MPGRCGPRTAGTQRKHKHRGTFAGRHNWQVETRSSWNATPLGSVACDVRESRSHGAGKPWWRRPGRHLDPCCGPSDRAWKSSAGTSGKCENGATSEARVWRGTSAYPRSPRAGPLWQACGVGRAACCGSATMGWRAVAPWWAMALMIETTSASSSNLQFWRNSQNPLFGEAALSCFMATHR